MFLNFGHSNIDSLVRLDQVSKFRGCGLACTLICQSRRNTIYNLSAYSRALTSLAATFGMLFVFPEPILTVIGLLS